jgi:TonB family protein
MRYIRCVTATVLLLASLIRPVQAIGATATQDDLNALQNALRKEIQEGPAAKSTQGADFRGRTASQDIADWVAEPATKKRLDELLAEQDDTARRAAMAILVDQARRMILVNDYWNTWPNLKRERDLWDQWVKLLLPQTSASDSIQRVKDREAEFTKTSYVPGADPAVLEADLNSLSKMYNRERLSLAKDANAKLATMSGRLPSRSRQTPCPSVEPSSGAATQPNRPVSVTGSPDVGLYYPDEARRSGSTGRVLVRLYIDDTGCAKKFEVVESAGDPTLDDAALRYAEGMRFRPALKDGKPVASEPKVPVNFALAD